MPTEKKTVPDNTCADTQKKEAGIAPGGAKTKSGEKALSPAEKKRRKRLLLAAAAILLLSCFLSKYDLEVNNYVLSSPKLTAPVRIVQLSDLHNSEFGRDNERLVRLVAKQQPDVILLTGDMINSKDPRTDIAARLIEQLAGIAPVYASYGNHEKLNEEIFGTRADEVYEKAGAHLLELEYKDIKVNGQKIRIGGIYGNCLPEEYLLTRETKRKDVEYLQKLQKNDRLTILLSHVPTNWVKKVSLEGWEIDCIFAGHAHGGQVRLPAIGGVYARGHGLLPGQMSGLYYSQNCERVLVLSRGLGSQSVVPRINNVPEIVVVDMLPQMKAAD
ncbi:MAG: metallophosphoesterase [Clostridia bacterium]|nr:metallophosphoesterase [Clostridia bacterium]